MTNVGFATVDIIPSAKGFKRALGGDVIPASERVGREGGKRMGEGMKASVLGAVKGIAGPLAAAFAVDKVVGVLKDSVAQASDLNEAGTALAQVFGDGVGAVEAFAGKGAKALGMSKLETMQAAQSFGVYGKAAGLAGQANAQFSNALVGLSTDLASFYNTSPEEAAQAIASGLRGEAEPLRRFGILLDDATLRQEALKQGLIKTTKDALTPQQKVMAAQAVIMRQSKVAQGDFARTSGGLANQQRILAAQWVDMKGKLGAALLPAVLGATKGLNGLFDVVTPLASRIKGDFKSGLSQLATGWRTAGGDIGKVQTPLGKVGLSLASLYHGFTGQDDGIQSPWLDWLANSGATVAAALDRIKLGLTGVTDILFKGDFTGALTQAFNIQEDSPLVDMLFRIRENAQALIQRVVTGFPVLVANVRGFFQSAAGGGALIGIVQSLGANFQTLLGVALVVFDWLRANVLPIFAAIAQVVVGQVVPVILMLARFLYGTLEPALIRIVMAVASRLVPVFTAIASVIRANVVPAVSLIIAKFAQWWPTIQRVIMVVVSIIGWILRLAATILGAVLPPLIRFVGFLLINVVRAVLAVIGVVIRIISAVLRFGAALVGGVQAADRFSGGIRTHILEALRYIGDLPGRALRALGNLGGTLTSAGSDLIWGFIRGIESRAGDIIGSISRVVTQGLPDYVRKALGIHSPSRVMRALGAFAGDGFALGIGDSTKGVLKASSGLAAAALPDTPGGAPGSSSSGGSSGAGGGATFHIYDTDGVLLGTMRGAARAEAQDTARGVSRGVR